VKNGKVIKKSNEPCGFIQARLKNLWAAEKRPNKSFATGAEVLPQTNDGEAIYNL